MKVKPAWCVVCISVSTDNSCSAGWTVALVSWPWAHSTLTVYCPEYDLIIYTCATDRLISWRKWISFICSCSFLAQYLTENCILINGWSIWISILGQITWRGFCCCGEWNLEQPRRLWGHWRGLREMIFCWLSPVQWKPWCCAEDNGHQEHILRHHAPVG